MHTQADMKWLGKDVLIPVLLVCFIYPLAAGLWWRYFSGHSDPSHTELQVALPEVPAAVSASRAQ